MSIHPQIIEKDGREGLIVLPDEEFAASRSPSSPLFISAFQHFSISAFQIFSFYPMLFFNVGRSTCPGVALAKTDVRCSSPCSAPPVTSTPPAHEPASITHEPCQSTAAGYNSRQSGLVPSTNSIPIHYFSFQRATSNAAAKPHRLYFRARIHL